MNKTTAPSPDYQRLLAHLDNLDRAASIAPLIRNDHALVQQGLTELRQYLTEASKNADPVDAPAAN